MASDNNVAAATGHLHSPLFKLPAELRNAIWELVVAEDQPLHVEPPLTYRLDRADVGTVLQPPLTKTCRAIRTEALPIFYSANKFCIGIGAIETERWARRWLEAIGAASREALCHVYIDVGGYYAYFRAVDSFRRARSRFLRWLRPSKEVKVGGRTAYVVELGCLTIDDD